MGWIVVAACTGSEPIECGEGGRVARLGDQHYCVYPAGPGDPPACPDDAPTLVALVDGHACLPESISVSELCEAEGITCVADAGPCTSDRTQCGDLCTNLENDRSNCGACNSICVGAEVCRGGRCFCDADTCGTTCTRLATDPSHCGRCEDSCAGGDICVDGECKPSGFSCSHPFNVTFDFDKAYVDDAPIDLDAIGRRLTSTIDGCIDEHVELYLSFPYEAAQLLHVSTDHPAVTQIGRTRCMPGVTSQSCRMETCGGTVKHAVFDHFAGQGIFLELDPAQLSGVLRLTAERINAPYPAQLSPGVETQGQIIATGDGTSACGAVGYAVTYWYPRCPDDPAATMTLDWSADFSEVVAVQSARYPRRCPMTHPATLQLEPGSDLLGITFGRTQDVGGDYLITSTITPD